MRSLGERAVVQPSAVNPDLTGRQGMRLSSYAW